MRAFPRANISEMKPEVNSAMALTAGSVDHVSDIPTPIAALGTTDQYFGTKIVAHNEVGTPENSSGI